MSGLSKHDVDWRKFPIRRGEDMQASPHFTLVALSSQPESVSWSDRYFMENYVMHIKKKLEPVLDTAVQQAKVFLKFYYTSNTHIEDLVESVICLLYSMDIDGTKLVRGEHLIGDGAWETPKDTYKWNGPPTSPLFYDQPATTSNENAIHIATRPGQNNITFTANKLRDWADAIWLALDEGSLDAKREAINYLGFLAGICVRLIIKDTESVSRHIYTMADDRYRSLFGKEVPFGSTPAPITAACALWSCHIRKQTSHANRILTVCITAKVYASQAAKTITDGAWEAMCLLSLGSVGLGAISWSEKAAEAMSMTLSKFLSHMCLGNYRRTAHKVIRFLEMVGETGQQTCMFGRLFQDGAFIELSTRNNPEFVMACAAISTGATLESEIWKIQQFNNFTSYIKTAVVFAMCFKEHHKHANTANPDLADSRDFARKYESLKDRLGPKLNITRREANTGGRNRRTEHENRD